MVVYAHERLTNRPLHTLAYASNHQQNRFVALGTQDGRRVKGDLRLDSDALQGPVVDKGLALGLPHTACHRLAVAGQNGLNLLVGVAHGRPPNPPKVRCTKLQTEQPQESFFTETAHVLRLF